jgi:hypothetical protein
MHDPLSLLQLSGHPFCSFGAIYESYCLVLI